MPRTLIAFVLLISFATAAQPQSPLADPALLQKAITVLQTQRNQAMDAHANAEMRVLQLTEELAKLKAEVEEAAKKEKPKDGPRP